MRAPRKINGRKRKVLIAGEYPLVPGGNIWFELIMELGYKRVDPRHREELERELSKTFETAQTAFAWCRNYTEAPVGHRSPGGDALEDGERGTGGDTRDFGDSERSWGIADAYPSQTGFADTEAPAPPEESEEK